MATARGRSPKVSTPDAQHEQRGRGEVHAGLEERAESYSGVLAGRAEPRRQAGDQPGREHCAGDDAEPAGQPGRAEHRPYQQVIEAALGLLGCAPRRPGRRR